MTLCLFDIDGTLLHSRGLSKDLYLEALSETFGTPLTFDAVPGRSWRGLTDYGIAQELLRWAAVPESEWGAGIPAAFERLGELWMKRGTPEDIELYDGVIALLDMLEEADIDEIGLFTANCAAGAAHKIRLSGLEAERTRFRFSASGDAVVTKERVLTDFLQGRSESVAAKNGWVIGDSPADIEAARACGLRSVGVCTGWYRADALKAARPDLLFDNFSDPAAVVSSLFSFAQKHHS